MHRLQDSNLKSVFTSNSCNNLTNLNNPKVVFFVSSSIIRNLDSINIEAINYTLSKHELSTITDISKQKIDSEKSLKESFITIFGKELSNLAYDEYAQYLSNINDKISFSDGTIDLLKYLKKDNIKTVFVSNFIPISIDKILEQYELKSYFDFVILPDDQNPAATQIFQLIEKLNLKLREDTLLFVGDSITDILFSFRYGFVPIIFNKHEFQSLEAVNLDNPIRFIENFNQLIELFENSKIQEDEKVVKITYIGAGGKIGKQAIPMICNIVPSEVTIEIILIGSGSEESLVRLSGFVSDIEGSLNLCSDNDKHIKFTITNEYKKICGSKVVLCSAGKWPSAELSKKFERIDPTGRTKQSFMNKDMIEDIAQRVQSNAPDCLFVIATNQVDMMCEVARLKAPKLKTIGITGCVDSSRMKQIIKSDFGLEASCFMVGYHDSSMMPLISSVKVDGKPLFPFISGAINLNDDQIASELKMIESDKFDKVVSKTRKLGGLISSQQKTGVSLKIDTGASILPAKAMAKVVAAFCFGQILIESFNTFITDQKVADHYGVPTMTALSIPVVIDKDKIEQLTEIPVLDFEKVKLREAQIEMKKTIQLLIKGGLIDE